MHYLNLTASISTGLSEAPHLAWAIPFVVLLASIAIVPLVNRHLWEHHYPKITSALALIPTIYYLFIRRDPGPWLGAMEEYIGFIILLASLFVISGGIVLRVNRKATPMANVVLLLIGAILANVFGTTGASMLLIRPYIHMNRGHMRPYHIILFIFIVANCGGLLTPIGDPPLFLGYLQGIPFRWTLDNLWPIWLLANGLLLGLFYLLDLRSHRASPRAAADDDGPQVHVLGIHNFVFVAVVLFGVFRPSVFEIFGAMHAMSVSAARIGGVLLSREVVMVAALLASRWFTPKRVYEHNHFSYQPIREVAIVFVAIFSTMTPALGWLEANARRMSITTPGAYYFTTGSLSATLDNAPTYLTFLKMRLSSLDDQHVSQAVDIIADMHRRQSVVMPNATIPADVQRAVAELVADHGTSVLDGTLTPEQVRVGFLVGVPRLSGFLVAISAGAVLFGAATYIGNGPNFMVRSIAEAAGVNTPDFARYIFCYSLPILVPLYVIVWWVFL